MPPSLISHLFLFAGKKMETYPASLKPDHNKLKTLNKNCAKSIKVSQHRVEIHTSLITPGLVTWLQENKQLYKQYHLFFFEAVPHQIHFKIVIFYSKENSHTSYLIMAKLQINKIKTMLLISCVGCSLVTLEWGHKTCFVVCCRDNLM